MLCSVWCLQYPDCMYNCHCCIVVGFMSNVSTTLHVTFHRRVSIVVWRVWLFPRPQLLQSQAGLGWPSMPGLGMWGVTYIVHCTAKSCHLVSIMQSITSGTVCVCTCDNLLTCHGSEAFPEWEDELGGHMGILFLLEFCYVILLPLPNCSHRYVIECKHCGIIFRSRQHWYGNLEPEQKAIKTENKHVWPEVRRVSVYVALL